MQVRVRGTNLYGYWCTILGELFFRDIKPVMGFRGRTLVCETEHDERLVDAVLGADSFYAVLSTFQWSVEG